MLQNVRVTAFTVSELLRKIQQRGWGNYHSPQPLSHTHRPRLQLTGWSKYFLSPNQYSVNKQFLCFTKNIKIYGKCICFGKFSINGINFVGNSFESSGIRNHGLKLKTIFIYWNLKNINACY